MFVKRFFKSTVIIATGLFCTISATLAADSAKDQEAPDRSVYNLSLKQSEEMALQYSSALRAAKMGREEAAGQRMAALGEVLPTVNLGVTKTFADSYDTANTGQRGDRFSKTYVGSVSVSQPLYSGGKAFSAMRAAKLNTQSAEEDIRQATQGLLYNVRVLYYEILLDKELVRVSKEQVALAQKSLEDEQKRLEMETSTAYDVLRAEVEKTNEQTALTGYQNSLLIAKSSFMQLLGLPLSSEPVLTDKLRYNEIARPEEAELYRQALSMRPEIRSSQIGINLQAENIKYTRADLFPHLSLSGSYSRTGLALDRDIKDYEKDWTVGLTMSWNIFDGLLVRGQLREQRAAEKRLQYEHRDLTDSVRLQVRTALLNIESAQTSVRGQQRNTEQAKESLRLTLEREKQGVSTHLDVLTARQTLAEAERNYYSTIFDYRKAWADLALAIGVIGENTDTSLSSSSTTIADEASEEDVEESITKTDK